MAEEKESIFIQYVQKRKRLIKDKKILQTTYVPEQLPHRKDQIEKIVSIISIKLLLRYIKKNDFKAFGWYRIALGIIVLLYLFIVGDPVDVD